MGDSKWAFITLFICLSYSLNLFWLNVAASGEATGKALVLQKTSNLGAAEIKCLFDVSTWKIRFPSYPGATGDSPMRMIEK